MKKHIALLAALVMAVSTLTACGSKSETDNTATSETTITTLSTDAVENDVSADTETEATTEETTIETEPEAAVHADIEEASPCYYGGVMFKTTEKGPYYYRFSDKKLFDLSENYKVYNYDNSYVSGSVAIMDGAIINIDTNDVLYDLSNNTASIVESWGRKFGNTGSLVIATPSQNFNEESSVTILKNDGSIAGTIPDSGIDTAIAISDRYVQFSDSTTRPGTTIYDVVNMTNLNLAANSVEIWSIENENYLYYMDREKNIVQYNKNTGDPLVILSGNEYTDVTWMTSVCPYGIKSGYREIDVIDMANDNTVHFDISSFVNKCDSDSMWLNWACSKYVLMSCKKSGNSYIAMLDSNGNTFFDPIAIDNAKTISCNDKYVIYGDEKTNFVYDIDANNITYLDEGLTIESSDIASDILLIKDSNGNYFLANAATPNDLYSPFDDYVQ